MWMVIIGLFLSVTTLWGQDEICLESNNLYVDESGISHGYCTAHADGDGWTIQLTVRIDFQADARYQTSDVEAEESRLEYDGEELRITEARFAIGTTDEGRRALRGTIKTENTQQFRLDILSPDALQGDVRWEDYEGYFDEQECLVFVEHQSSSGAVIVQAANANKQVVAITLMGAVNAQHKPVIAEGVYTVSEQMVAGTVMQSPGLVGGKVYTSYAGWQNEYAEVILPVWFITEGTLSVTKDGGVLRLVLDGSNSYGRKVKVRMDVDERMAYEPADRTNLNPPTWVRKKITNHGLEIEGKGYNYFVSGQRIQ